MPSAGSRAPSRFELRTKLGYFFVGVDFVVGHLRLFEVGDDSVELGLNLICRAGPVLCQYFLHDILELAIEKLGDLGVLGRHDAVDAEVEIRFIQFKQLSQLGLERVELGIGNSGRVWHSVYQIASKAMVKRVS